METKIENLKEEFKKAGLKVTPQRLAVYEALMSTTEHPSAEMVYRKVKEKHPTISLDTVNRTLLSLAELGLAFIIPGSGDAKRFDADLSTHQHFKCIKCKRIIDYEYEPYNDLKVPEEIEKRHKILSKSVLVEGICDKCLKEESE